MSTAAHPQPTANTDASLAAQPATSAPPAERAPLDGASTATPAGEPGLTEDAASARSVPGSAVGAEPAAAAAPPAATPAPVDPAVLKQQEKEHKQLEKKLHKDEKQDEKQLKSALKATQNQAKAEQKATKAESKARKLVDKYTTKEAKYAKGLARAQEKHDKMVATLNKAKQDLEIKTQERQKLVNERMPKQQALENQQHLKAEHDAARKAQLEGTQPHSAA
ncbi:hypothetical protein JCM10213_001918 [Rhodosporidiobolus nylandii]